MERVSHGIQPSHIPVKAFLRLLMSVLFVTAGPVASPARARTPVVVSDAQAEQHIGQDVTVEGVVTAVSTSRKGNTFINFGGAYPNQTFTGWIPAGTPLATDGSISTLQGKKIKITGRIELYRGKPEIRVLSKSQIAEE
jgi:DNA/RNA endonuclease YhcR with UshA esterase domain